MIRIVDFSALRDAVPYIMAFRDRAVVVKLGGELCEDPAVLNHIVEQLALFHCLGLKLVVVHGGGKHATALGEKLGVESQFVAGRRITSSEMLEVAKMSFAGSMNTDMVAAFKRNGLAAVGISAIDGKLVTAKRREATRMKDPEDGREKEIDFGFVGDIESINPALLNNLLSGGYIPVICSLASDATGQILNINADTLASRLAISLGALKLMILGTVDGVMADLANPDTLYSVLSTSEIRDLIENKTISGGMIPKLSTAVEAIKGGVSRVHIINGTNRDALLQEIFTNEGAGTMVVPD